MTSGAGEAVTVLVVTEVVVVSCPLMADANIAAMKREAATARILIARLNGVLEISARLLKMSGIGAMTKSRMRGVCESMWRKRGMRAEEKWSVCLCHVHLTIEVKAVDDDKRVRGRCYFHPMESRIHLD